MVVKKIWSNFSFVIIFMLISFVCLYIMINRFSMAPTHEDFFTIVAGDHENLWEMAEQYKHLHNMDTDEFILWVKKENQLQTFRLEKGTEIVLPIQKDHLDIRHLAGGNE